MTAEKPATRSPLEQLDSGLDYRLVLLVAPAGAGKTCLLRRWAALYPPAYHLPLAWLSLEAADNLPQRFLDDLLQALAPILNAGISGLGSLTWRVQTLEIDLETAIIDLINALDGFAHDFILVLDNYHVINAMPVHSAVRLLLDYLPPHAHLIIASRSEPPLQIPRLRVRRQLLEIGLPGEKAWDETE